MVQFLIRRFLWMLFTLWVVFTATWVLQRVVPGGPFDQERTLEPHVKANLEARFHLDEPWPVQYGRDLVRYATFDFGYPMKMMTDFSINQILAQGFPVSAALGLLALFFALTLGLFAGVISAINRAGLADLSLMSVATIGIALPNFVIAGVAILLLVFTFPVFPAAGWGRVEHLILPAFCLGAPFAAYIARLARTGMLDVLSQDYIRTARAKGLSQTDVILDHALKGAILPVVSYLGPAIAGILTGSLVVEQIFNIPGIGVYFIEAAINREYPLAMAVVLVYTLLLFAMNTLVDISYSFFDPRITLEK